jgi:perosamine synthetase
MIRLSKPYIHEKTILKVNEILRSGFLTQGKHVNYFEQRLKEYTRIQNVAVVSSGTAALHLAVLALGIKQGDVVFVPAFTFPATVNVVEAVGAKPVFVDVDINTYNMDLDLLEQTLINWQGSETPKAIIIVHEFGCPANMTRLLEITNKFNLYIVEDAACALGTMWEDIHVGSFGNIGCFSWHPRKSITTGEGGAVVTQSQEILERIYQLRNHGISKNAEGVIDFVLPGLNYRLTDFQAVIGSDQLMEFPSWLEKRMQLVENYNSLLNSEDIIKPRIIKGHSFQTYMIIVDKKLDRQKIINKMKEKGIEVGLGAQSVPQLKYYKNKYYYQERYENANTLYNQGLALPLHPYLESADIQYICSSLLETINETRYKL